MRHCCSRFESVINAGTGANNVIPGEAQVLFNLRYNPNWQAARLEAECEAVLRAHGLAYAIQWHRGGEPFYTPEGELRDAARAVLAASAGMPPEENGELRLASVPGASLRRRWLSRRSRMVCSAAA